MYMRTALNKIIKEKYGNVDSEINLQLISIQLNILMGLLSLLYFNILNTYAVSHVLH